MIQVGLIPALGEAEAVLKLTVTGLLGKLSLLEEQQVPLAAEPRLQS